MISTKNPRVIVAEILTEALHEEQPLMATVKLKAKKLSVSDASFLKELVNGILRNKLFLEGILDILLEKPFKSKSIKAKYAILAGLYQLAFLNTPNHAAVNETVKAVGELGFDTLKGLTNAVMHGYLRKKAEIDERLNKSYETKYSFPQWLISDIKSAYGKSLGSILEQSNNHPPLTIRINTAKVSLSDYINLLAEKGLAGTPVEGVPCALTVTPAVNAEELPLFKEGFVFIQDAAAQQAAIFLDPQPGEVILDACAAPGGKTTHILEICPEIKDLVALDLDEGRLKRVKDNLHRLGLEAKIIAADASSKDHSWSPYPQFDRILLDAPCSATGVIRRHPDIKWLRTPEEIKSIVKLQREILENMWQMLKSGGIMLYATCSIEPVENTLQIKQFLSEHKDAELIPLKQDESADNPGLQILPGQNSMDGFFYARLKKNFVY